MSAPLLDVAGPAAPPRANGELVFTAPWEGRAFGLAVALAEAGVFTWDGFRDRLVARIAAPYYGCWLAACEDALVAAGRLDGDDVSTRAAGLAARPAGHDHNHDHAGHGHGHVR
ncbi:nitrile hydratase accessory protein [Pseudonocardia sp. ICBG162]|uniref:nitrile hydratase accessory protein n=1 Tax=Pseudonocardia sp. ICBG162 TaxID=2846761 RepID=UPI001CF623BE|nr:nitrile hydratase accessory protein [Pseudonocardia sp. ICBG162]